MSVIECSWQIPYSISGKKLRYWVLNPNSEFGLIEYSIIVRKNTLIENSISTQNLNLLSTQWYYSNYQLIEHSISTQNLDLLSTQSWVLNFNHFFVGDWVLNIPNIEWTLCPPLTLRFGFLSHMDGPTDRQRWLSSRYCDWKFGKIIPLIQSAWLQKSFKLNQWQFWKL